MKLLYLANKRFPTEKAYGIQIAKMCEAFMNVGVKVNLVVPTRKSATTSNPFEYYKIKRNFRFTRITSPDFYLPGILDRVVFYIKQFISAWRLVYYARKSGADIFYTRDELVALLLNWFNLQNIVFEVHNFSSRRAIFYKYFQKKNNKIVALNKKLSEELYAFGFSQHHILIAHDGFDKAEFMHMPEKEKTRQFLGLPENTHIVMYAGHLFAWKGVHVLAKAATLMPNALFVFVGGITGAVERFHNLCDGIKNVLIVGHKPHADIPLYLAAADVLILPNVSTERRSMHYTSPLKLFEYMAAMRPIVASDLPSLREILNEKNAIFFEANNSQALAKAIERALSDTELTTSIVRQAAHDVQDYTWDKRAACIISHCLSQKHCI
jgi:glycosyltransferase involved in cell wall biosynthesis